MKTTKSSFKSFTFKALLFFISITFTFAGVTRCDAQSVVGRWKRTGTKIFETDKATGKQTPVSAQKQLQYDQASAANGYNEMLEFKSDNTYISTVSKAGETKPTSHTGNYSISGNILDMKIPLVNNEKTTITIQSIKSGTMVWDLVFMGKLTEIIYSKM